MRRINIFLTERQIATLKALARKTGLSYAELVRRAIDDYIKRHHRDA